MRTSPSKLKEVAERVLETRAAFVDKEGPSAIDTLAQGVLDLMRERDMIRAKMFCLGVQGNALSNNMRIVLGDMDGWPKSEVVEDKGPTRAFFAPDDDACFWCCHCNKNIEDHIDGKWCP